MEASDTPRKTLVPEEEAKLRIPHGFNCYIFKNVEGIPMSEYNLKVTEQFRKDRDFKALQEATSRIYPVFCPYWSRTDYGTNKCNYLEIEAVGMDDVEDWVKARKHFGSDEAIRAACAGGQRLATASKECNVNTSLPQQEVE